MSKKQTMVLRELYRISERRDNSVYKTEYVCDVWVDPNQPNPDDYQFVTKNDANVVTIGTLITAD